MAFKGTFALALTMSGLFLFGTQSDAAATLIATGAEPPPSCRALFSPTRDLRKSAHVKNLDSPQAPARYSPRGILELAERYPTFRNAHKHLVELAESRLSNVESPLVREAREAGILYLIHGSSLEYFESILDSGGLVDRKYHRYPVPGWKSIFRDADAGHFTGLITKAGVGAPIANEFRYFLVYDIQALEANFIHAETGWKYGRADFNRAIGRPGVSLQAAASNQGAHASEVVFAGALSNHYLRQVITADPQAYRELTAVLERRGLPVEQIHKLVVLRQTFPDAADLPSFGSLKSSILFKSQRELTVNNFRISASKEEIESYWANRKPEDLMKPLFWLPFKGCTLRFKFGKFQTTESMTLQAASLYRQKNVENQVEMFLTLKDKRSGQVSSRPISLLKDLELVSTNPDLPGREHEIPLNVFAAFLRGEHVSDPMIDLLIKYENGLVESPAGYFDVN